MTKKKVGVLGCGWLGEAFAQKLVSEGYVVRGSTTHRSKTARLRKAGIEPYLIELKSGGFTGPIAAFLEGLDVLVFNIPPGLRSNPAEDYMGKIRHLDSALKASDCPRMIYVSSISVYGRAQGMVDEKVRPVPDSHSGKQLLAAEDLIDAAKAYKSLILRFGGLIGPDRHPVTRLSGKSDLSGGGDPVNLIHREDCIRLMYTALERPGWTGRINAVSPEHPTKAAYYKGIAAARGLPLPEFREASGNPGARLVRSCAPELDAAGFMRSIYD